MTTADTPIFPADLMTLLGIKHSNTLRVHIKDNRIPPPDVRITAKTRYWHRATLVRAGLLDGQNKGYEQHNAVANRPVDAVVRNGPGWTTG